MAASGEQDLEHLLWSGTAQVARAQRANAVLDRERAEETDQRTLRSPSTFLHAHAHSDEREAADIPAGSSRLLKNRLTPDGVSAGRGDKTGGAVGDRRLLGAERSARTQALVSESAYGWGGMQPTKGDRQWRRIPAPERPRPPKEAVGEICHSGGAL